ncbi:MAG: FecR domain-containing protein [Candidatus Omnitrophica bacterium]|nr:FecR domain-containing protein [Candidatus Omnitrophota bacterium]
MRVFTIAIMALLMCGFAVAADAAVTQRTATIVEMEGTVEVQMPDAGQWMAANLGMELTEGCTVRTETDSLVVLQLHGVDAANVEIKERSEMRLAEFFEDKDEATQRTLLDLAIGEILITSKKLQSEKSKFEVKTPTSIVGVRGTTFSVSVETE